MEKYNLKGLETLIGHWEDQTRNQNHEEGAKLPERAWGTNFSLKKPRKFSPGGRSLK